MMAHDKDLPDLYALAARAQRCFHALTCTYTQTRHNTKDQHTRTNHMVL
jgi:hypothetical protein